MSSTGLHTTILLIDGHDRDRTYYADRLKFLIADCVVLEAKTGQKGLELYKTRPLDCIVTELDLPDMSGFEVLLTVIHRASYPEIAVVILTHMTNPYLVEMAKTNGAQAVLAKRSTAGDLLAPAILNAIAVVGPTRKDRP